ncbi:MAG TPA: hypothetical protein VFI31_04800 [Pirellulales bacterium]|nr:hypothetical protein [Pirellulales bacterium]
MRFSLSALLACLLCGHSAFGEDPQIGVNLSPNAAAWQARPYQGTLDTVAIDADGQAAAAVGTNGLVLTTAAPIERDTEIRVRFRISLPPGQGSGLYVVAGQKQPNDSAANALAVQLYAYPAAEQETLSWTLSAMPGESQGLAGSYTARSLPANRLLMPDMTRRRIEQDFAAEPTLAKRWLTVQYQLRKNSARLWLDGRLLRESRHPQIDTTGFVRLHFLAGAQVSEVEVRDLPPQDPRFELVSLDHHLNTAKFGTATIERQTLPPAGQPVIVGGVPFLLPRPDERGRTHVDLKPSWLRCGLVEGGQDPVYSDLPRWRGATDRDPARIQFRIPNGQYTRLHLLAAYTGEADTTPVVSAQFYRDNAGHPVNFTRTVPDAKATSPAMLPVASLAGNLHLVTIPLDPNGPVAFSDQRHLELELTKELRIYRAFPDPTYYSMHGAGLPSGVHVFGVTLERPAVEVDFQPDQVAHVWTSPAQPSYTATLKNTTTAAQTVELELATTSHDGSEKTVVRQAAQLAAGATQAVKLPLALKRYGCHAVELTVRSAGEEQKQTRSLAYLHPDTRERGNWSEGKGPIFGMWDWNGGHLTIGGMDRLRVMAAAGMESSMGSFASLPSEEQKFLESIGAKSFFVAYQLAMNKTTLGGIEWDPTKPAEMQAALIKWLKEQPYTKPSPVNEPELAVFFAEPLLGPVSYRCLPEYYGDPPYQMTPDERAAYQKYLDQFLIAAAAIKKEWPNAKCLFPWGIPNFPIPFLRESKEATALMDGPAIDQVLFERMPEMQIHQVTVASAMWQLKQEWLKTGKPWPSLSTIEGPGTSPARPGAVTPQEEADHTVRVVLILSAYNTTRFLGWPAASHCAGYWGEQHYGSGLCEPIPLLSPRPVYSAYATMTRQLNRRNFVRVVPTPSNSVFCLQFKHSKTGELLHVLWTLRGKRPVIVGVPKGAALEIFDSMDNSTKAAESGGQASFTIGTSPVYVYGLSNDLNLTLGSPDHSDAAPGPHATLLSELGDGSWKQSQETDADYEQAHEEFIRRFPGNFSVAAGEGREPGGKALAVRLEKQDKERRTMPFYATLVPSRPIVIPGKASHLGLWVKAASDWGRVVYSLKDAKGERWLSVGKKAEWNVDDTHNWSAFNFDGWRYITFELPGNSPYDQYREAGATFWGSYQGDVVVDLPLTLEKIIVERRTHVIHATEQREAAGDDVLLGALYAEYERPADKTDEAVRLSRLQMPLPDAVPDLANPIRKLDEAGTSPGPEITKINPPEREYDGRRCHVHFAPLDGATAYDIWVSTYSDGRGAVLLGKDWAAPGQLLSGLSPNVDLYLFVVAKDASGKLSKPGKPFKVNLKDMFPMK